MVSNFVYKNKIEIDQELQARLQREEIMSVYFHHTDEGLNYYLYEKDAFWRVVNYVDSITFNVSDDLGIIEATGKAFEDFQTQLSDFDGSVLYETIPDFHNTKKRLDTLFSHVADDPCGRAAEVQKEIDYIAFVREKAAEPSVQFASGEILKRVTHNDTKCNNVLFDRKTKEPIVVIDLDTIMPGMSMYEEYGDEAANIIVDEKGILYAQDVYDGFSPEIMDMLHLIATPIGVMPDPSVSVEDMKKCGYTYLGMVPMGAEAASEHFKQGGMMVYALHPDGTESVIENEKQFDRHVENGGLFAVDKEDWMKYLENGEFLRTTEISTEQNYNMIDGRRNNMEPHKKEKPSKEKESLLGRLKEKQQLLIANARKEDKEKRAERDLP